MELPRIQMSDDVVEDNRKPTLLFQKWWLSVAKKIERFYLSVETAPVASSATTTHKVPVVINGVTYYILLSDV